LVRRVANAPAPTIIAPALAELPVPREILRLRPRAGRGLAAFDADGTLWHGDVSEDFAQWMVAHGHFDAARWPDYLAIAAQDSRAACFSILELYAGMARAAIDAHVARFWREAPPRRWLRCVRAAIDAVRATGLRAIVVSGTPTPVFGPLREHLEVDGVLALDLEFDAAGRATGRHAGIPTVGEGKAARLRDTHTEPLLLAAGNSHLDHAMLALSEGIAWAVNPDAALRAAAEQAGWLITEEPEGTAARAPKEPP
jgi:HAD superfamily phosphoserine phosphatase-like hydrolase